MSNYHNEKIHRPKQAYITTIFFNTGIYYNYFLHVENIITRGRDCLGILPGNFKSKGS